MKADVTAIVASMRTRPGFIAGIVAGGVLLYFVLQLVAMVVRFEALPNYVIFHDYIDNIGLIVSGTPDIQDMIPILMDEMVIEVGYMNPEWGIAEWYLSVLPVKTLLVAFLFFLLAVVLVLVGVGAGACSRQGAATAYVAAGSGTSLAALSCASLGWVVCCATPTWVVGLAMLGVSTNVALALEPLGAVMAVAGIVLLLFAIHTLVAHRDRRAINHGYA